MNSESSSVPRQRRVASPELDRLELTIRRLIEAHDGWRHRAATAEARVRELEAALQDVAGGRFDPVAMAEESDRLEERNRMLRERLDRARAVVERMTARLHFGEEER
jgi:hypothetical protein